MLRLVAKELRGLLPIILLIAGIEVIGNATTFWTEFVDMKTLQSELNSAEDSNGFAVILSIYAVLLAAGLLVRERDDGTLNFLDGLPVSRSRIFFGKALAALAVLTVALSIELGFAALFHALSRDSLEKEFPWQLFGALFGLHWVVCFVSLGLALALSFLRRWLFLALGLIGWVFVLVKQLRLPHADLFNPYALTVTAIHDGRWVIPQTNLSVQLALGLVAFGIALAGFGAMGDRAQRLAASRWLRLVAAIGTLLIPVVWIALAVKIGSDSNVSADEDFTPKGDDAAVTKTSAHFTLLHRQAQEAEGKALFARADAVREQVAALLGEPAGTGTITVDTTSRMARHNAGQAYWKKVRMQLLPEALTEENVAVLGHETTHVFLDQLSEFRLTPRAASVRLFHEGLASYVEYRCFRTPEALRAFRRVAAVAHAWQPVSFEQFVNDAELSRKRDRNLVYPVGEMFCAAIVKCYGDAALGKIARAFARRDAPKGLEHADLWQDTLQACGFSLETVLAEFRASLDRLVAEERAFIDKLPRVKAEVEFVPGEIIVRPAFDGEAPGELVCISRPSADAAEYEHDYPSQEADGTFHIPRAHYERGTFWYQLGWRLKEDRLPMLEAWNEVAIRP